MIPKSVVICGGGFSIKEGLSLGLKDALKDTFVITCNYAFKHFDNTFTTFVDRAFYKPSENDRIIKHYTDYSEELKKLPILIGRAKSMNPEAEIWGNTSFVKTTTKYSTDPLKNGFYCGILESGNCGIFALSIAEFLLDYSGTIYLLGFDWNKQPTKDSHYYSKEELNHGGQGQTYFYERYDASMMFKQFVKSHLKIYNVSMNSGIECFDKLSYGQFLDAMAVEYVFNNKVNNQEALREEILYKLKIYEKAH
jgi:hypothetical protein